MISLIVNIDIILTELYERIECKELTKFQMGEMIKELDSLCLHFHEINLPILLK